MVREAPLHHYETCPRCKSQVSDMMRYCRKCSFWLASPGAGLRPIDPESGLGQGWMERLGATVPIFQSFVRSASGALIVAVIFVFILVTYIDALLPHWLRWGPQTRKSACYANMRAIQTSLEQYLLEKKFSPELASDPVGVLYRAKVLQTNPQCQDSGNRYRIPKGSSLQCVGSEGHGLP